MKKITIGSILLLWVLVAFSSCIAINYQKGGYNDSSYQRDYNSIISSDLNEIVFENSDNIEIVFNKESRSTTVSGYGYKAEMFNKRMLISKASGKIYVSTHSALNIILNGSGNAKISNEDGLDLNIVSNGSGDIKLRGKSNQVTIKSVGSGNIYMSDLKTKYLNLHITGSGDAVVGASENADITLDGSGNVKMKGSYNIVNKMGRHAYNIK